ncbi:hypothetical protein RHCH11_RHCH11_04172 [Beijerinckiaceae bacterium RH CH11]|nr:hypothetical protein RHCH11_RHCH11_04172 [Beijerinckiaceae bacterium RH CH11]VVB50291.1 hypothetical protein RHAL8_04169 [Beijerinckiaceae bacterium RH AL8]
MHNAISGHFGQLVCAGTFGQQSIPSIIIAEVLACADRAAVNGARNSPAIKHAAKT